ncbi:MAG TPA: hypothetical protein VGV37_02455 [Aliidongia sp.]|uniref:hypothetical protein n=1 Tax=Aliidongia sp. TaxID=1914230 RepID=UPI002DDD7565|nr:hypothetical protein [Aliidongia sp.]HEV2673372.1 hypothetical protein [Aliidongia sp.]
MADFLSQALDVLKTAAPEVAALIGGPLAGQGVQLIEQTLGLAPTGDAAAAATAVLGATPDQLIALKTAGIALQGKFIDAGVTLMQADNSDRASAREREAAVRDWIPGILAMVMTCGFFSLLALLSLREVPASSQQLLNTMVGVLGTAWVAMVAYYFGSSSGSARATELLAKSGPAP